MSDPIIRLSAGDFDETMRFLNEAFGEHRPHDFAGMLPSIYQPTDKHMRCNYAVRERGQIAALVGVFPIDWRVGKVSLKVAGIGGVGVHPDFRGRGLMKRLMNHAVDTIGEQGYDLSYLGGRRQRYAYFGYEVAGLSYRLSFNQDNVRHAFAGKDQEVQLEPVSNDAQTIASLKKLHDAQPLYCQRPAEAFNHYLQSWFYQPMLARDREGKIVGYLAAHQEKNQINELVAQDPQAAAQIVRPWVLQSDADVQLCLSGPTEPVLRRLGEFAETVTTEPTGNWRIFDWPRVVDALLKAQHAASPLMHGSVSLGIGDTATVFRLTVDDQGARCESVKGPADLTADPLTMTRLLFGPLPSSAVMQLPPAASILSAWCPLPLGFSPQDKV